MVSARMSFGPPIKRTPVVLGTIILLFLIYVVTGLALQVAPGFEPTYLRLVLVSADVLAGEVWRLLSYGFLHSLFDPFHVVFNCLTLFFFGRDLELRWGRGRFILFLIGAVIFGGLCVLATGVLQIGTGAALGFSAATQACLVAWAMANRNNVVNFFFLPPMRGIWVIAIALVLWLLDAVSQSPMSASAHFGGIVLGLIVGSDVGGRWKTWKKRRASRKFTVVPKDGGWVN